MHYIKIFEYNNCMMKKDTFKYIIAYSILLLVAVLGTVFVNLGMDWFDTLVKPSEWVPNVVIPIVWTVIYILFAIYLWFAIKNDRLDTETIALLIANGILNVLWCLVFFTLNSLLWGLIFIIINLIIASVLLIEMQQKDKFFSYFLTLYPVWLAIATCLNLACWILN